MLKLLEVIEKSVMSCCLDSARINTDQHKPTRDRCITTDVSAVTDFDIGSLQLLATDELDVETRQKTRCNVGGNTILGAMGDVRVDGQNEGGRAVARGMVS